MIGHELGHVRNLDTRYALYVAVLVGLVALATDGFLRLVVEGWRKGAFVWSGDDDNGLGGPGDGRARRHLPAHRGRPAAGVRTAVLRARPGLDQPRARVPGRRDLGRVHPQPAPPSNAHWHRSRPTTTRSRPPTAARSTCGSATRSRPAATDAPAGCRPTRRSGPASIDCEGSRGSSRSTHRRTPPLQGRPRCRRPGRSGPRPCWNQYTGWPSLPEPVGGSIGRLRHALDVSSDARSACVTSISRTRHR